jgi:hypothetical protein
MFWLLEMVNRRIRFGVLQQFTSAFTETGDNMNLKPNALREKEEKIQMTPPLVKRLSGLLVLLHRVRMFARGTYFQKPFDFSLYTFASPNQRVTFRATSPTGRWPGRY